LLFILKIQRSHNPHGQKLSQKNSLQSASG
jgi:hypothetical protein